MEVELSLVVSLHPSLTDVSLNTLTLLHWRSHSFEFTRGKKYNTSEYKEKLI